MIKVVDRRAVHRGRLRLHQPGEPRRRTIPPATLHAAEYGATAHFGWRRGHPRRAPSCSSRIIGFDAVSTAAQEAKNPKRDMPIGILGSLVICTVLYMAVGSC